MTGDIRRGRGQPLAVLLALLVGWAGARATTWDWSQSWMLPEAALAVETANAAPAEQRPAYGGYTEQSYPEGPGDYGAGTYLPPGYVPSAQSYAVPSRGQFAGRSALAEGSAEAVLATLLAMLIRERGQVVDGGADSWRHGRAIDVPSNFPDRELISPQSRQEPRGGEFAGLIWQPAGTPAPNAQLASPERFDRRRWSVDAWTLLRGGSGEPSPGLFASSYGASQSGAIVRYRLSLHDSRRPTVYLRTTAALNGPADGDVGLGISGRPVPSIPIEAGVEGRVTQQGGRWRVRPAVLAVSQLPPLPLPLALRAEFYGQAGYVAGKYATPFADAQLRVDRSLIRVATSEARLGLGVWGGAQKGAARLDAGPGATVSLPLGRGLFGRAAIDWRFRLAGDAEPGSGPALTLSSGF